MTFSQPLDIQTIVKALLDAAQLRMSDEELESFARIYPGVRAGADGMYLSETRYEEPALIFDAEWTD